MMSASPQLPILLGIHTEEIRLDLPFELACARFSEDEGTVVLLSGSNQDCAKFHLLAAWPWLSLKAKGDRIRLDMGAEFIEETRDPFDVLQALVSRYALTDIPKGLPAASGLFGYFAYDLKDRIEDLPRTCRDTALPDLLLYAPSLVLIQDVKTSQTTLCIPRLSDSGGNPADGVQAVRGRFFNRLARPWQDGGFRVDARGPVSCYTKAEYVAAVNRVIDYLRAGDIYQANLSQRFETGFEGDTYGLFLSLFQRNPAAFFSYVRAADHQVVSTSPERFITLDGDRVETRPIKGTLARGTDPESDLRNGEALLASLKDDAELTMIVDLMRNDLSRVTVHDSVTVTDHKRLEPYDNVFHLVSNVEGRLSPGKTAVDLIRATFPGGSITGCPKIRSMEIIDELEPFARHVYTGSLGYISFHGTMDLSIAIRTATICDGRLVFSVGGGIVFDSDPELEFQETLDKGKTLTDTLREAAAGVLDPPLKAWVNGKFLDQDRAQVSAESTGFLYGAGLFETLKVEKGAPVSLEAHVARMEGSWKKLFRSEPPRVTWDRILARLVWLNGLSDSTCAVKLLLARDSVPGRTTMAAFIRPYVHRLEVLGKPGLDLVVYPEPRQSPLADYKTLNYLYYERAGAFARENGADEALILNPDGSVSETHTCNLFALSEQTLVLPYSPHVLPGITLGRLVSASETLGLTVRTQSMTWEELAEFSDVLAANSLMGIVRVMRINGREIRTTPGLCESLNRFVTIR